MISVTALLQLWTGANGRWHFIAVPAELTDEIRASTMPLRGFSSVRIEARIDEIRWQTSMFPIKGGGYFLPVKAKVRQQAGIGEGDRITVQIKLL